MPTAHAEHAGAVFRAVSSIKMREGASHILFPSSSGPDAPMHTWPLLSRLGSRATPIHHEKLILLHFSFKATVRRRDVEHTSLPGPLVTIYEHQLSI